MRSFNTMEIKYYNDLKPQEQKAVIGVAILVLAKLNGGNVKVTNNRVIIFFPRILYHALQVFFSPINYLINQVCYIQPNPIRWDDNKEYSVENLKITVPEVKLAKIQAKILAEENDTFKEEELVALFDSLPAAHAEDMVDHTYTGRIVRGGCFLDLVDRIIWPLKLIGCAWGKRYRSKYIGDPLLFSWAKVFFMPLPVWGNVGMLDIAWRGQSVATMNYDHQPWKDYFKVLSLPNSEKKVYLGVWTARDVSGGWFTLTLDPNTPAN